MIKLYKILLVLAALTAFAMPAVAGAADAPYQSKHGTGQACRSAEGGYCVNLASVQYAQIEEFLKDAAPETLVSALYVFGLSLVGLAALVVLVVGGAMYLTARDSADQIKRAQGLMTNAIFGLIIALLSWLILNTINPDLVKGGFPTLPKLAPVTSSTCLSNPTLPGCGAQQYQWAYVPINQYCIDVLGSGWRNVGMQLCGAANPPPGMNSCCALFPN